MAKYAVTVKAFASGAVAGTYKTAIGLKCTAGKAAKLQAVRVGGGGGAPQDFQSTMRITRTGNTTDGTSTAVVPAQKDPDSRASDMTGGKNYTVEPTTVETVPVLEMGFNSRGGLNIEYPPGREPEWRGAQTLLVSFAPGDNNAINHDVTVEWEE